MPSINKPPAPSPTPMATTNPEKPTATSDKQPTPPREFNNEGVFKVYGSRNERSFKHTITPSKHSTRANLPTVEWPGFSMTEDGGSEVVVLFSQKVSEPTEQHSHQQQRVYIFKNVRLLKSNNHNPLVTHFWNTPVAQARLISTPKELRLVIDFRSDQSVLSSTGIRSSQGGLDNQFFVKFPAGNYLPSSISNSADLQQKSVSP